MLLLIVVYAFLALTFVLTKSLLTIMDPLFLLVIRMGISGGICWAYVLSTVSMKAMSYRYLLYVGLVGFLNVYGANVLQMYGLRMIDSVYASLWYNSTPFIVAILDFFIYGTRITALKIISLCIGWSAFIPLLCQVSSYGSGNYWVGTLCFLISAVMMAISGLLLEKTDALTTYPMSLTNASIITIGTFCAAIHYLFFYHGSSCPITYPYFSLALLIGATVFCVVSYTYFVQRYGALSVTFAGFTLPIISLCLECFIGTNACVTVPIVLSISLISIALFLYTRREKVGISR